MTSTSLNLSGKINKIVVSVLSRINQISSSMNIPFFIVGATARDILLEIHYGIGSKRATLDIDNEKDYHTMQKMFSTWKIYQQHREEELKNLTHICTRSLKRNNAA